MLIDISFSHDSSEILPCMQSLHPQTPDRRFQASFHHTSIIAHASVSNKETRRLDSLLTADPCRGQLHSTI